jgi:hypothetical protein
VWFFEDEIILQKFFGMEEICGNFEYGECCEIFGNGRIFWDF